MLEDTEQTIEAPETDTTSTVETETPSEASETPASDTVEVEVETPEDVEAETPDTEGKEATVEATPEEVVPVTFDANEDLTVLEPKFTEVLEKYELPQEVQAVLDTYKAKAESNGLAQYSDYGDSDAVKGALDTHNLLYSARQEGEAYRPNTDQFAEKIAKTDPEKAQFLYYDLAKMPSQKYQVVTRFEEGLVDALGRDGDTVGQALKRYQSLVHQMKNDVVPESDLPTFIPRELAPAFKSLAREEREEYFAYEPDLDNEYTDNTTVRTNKLNTLAKIQIGIDGEIEKAQLRAESVQAKEATFKTEVATTLTKFYAATREAFTADLLKNVTFSPDAAVNKLLVTQQVTTLEKALEPDGEYARQVLAESGIKFDYAKAVQLDKAINEASVMLIRAKGLVDTQGNNLDPVALNKAKTQFENASRDYQAFARDIIEQEKTIISGKTDEAVKDAAKKLPVALKARGAVKGSPTQVKKTDTMPAHIRPMSEEWYEWNADQQMREKAAAQVAAYR